jgi:hypothetical protein
MAQKIGTAATGAIGAAGSELNLLGSGYGSEDTPSIFRKQVAHLSARFALPEPTACTIARLAYGEWLR